MYWMTFPWPWPKVKAVAFTNRKNICLHDKEELTHPITQTLCSCIPLVMPITRLEFGEIVLETFSAIFRQNYGHLLKVKHPIGHITGMVGPIDAWWKGCASVGYWVNSVTSTFDLTHDIDLEFFKVVFWNSCISGIVGLIDVKRKGSRSILD